MNSQRRWTYEQTGLALAGGLNTSLLERWNERRWLIHVCRFRDRILAQLQNALTVSLRFDSVAHAQAAGAVQVVPRSRLPRAEPGKIFGAVINSPGSVAAGQCTLVWEIEQFAQNYASGGSNIG